MLERLHPLGMVFYAGAVLLFACLLLHPLCVAIALLSAMTLAGMAGTLHPRQGFLFLPLGAFAVLGNLLWNERGTSIFYTTPWGSPMSLESLYFGLATAGMFLSLLLYCLALHRLLPPQVWLSFGGHCLPQLALLLRMSLSAIPQIKRQWQGIQDAQTALGIAPQTLRARLQLMSEQIASLLATALEDALSRADRMKSRGYGLPQKSRYHTHPLRRGDILLLLVLALGLGLLCWAYAKGLFVWTYFPQMTGTLSPWALALYALFCCFPILYHIREVLAWSCSP